MAMMAMTTSNSIRVNAECGGRNMMTLPVVRCRLNPLVGRRVDSERIPGRPEQSTSRAKKGRATQNDLKKTATAIGAWGFGERAVNFGVLRWRVSLARLRVPGRG